MPFEPGNKLAAGPRDPKPRRIRQQLVSALEEAAAGGPTKLRQAVDAIIAKAIAGDVAAWNAIADRVDGKPIQPVDGDGEGGPIKHELTVTFVGRTNPGGIPGPV